MCADFGKVLALDMLLGNADRLPCADLNWRGNSRNVLFGSIRSKHPSRLVAIDSRFSRQPPSFQVLHENATLQRVAELMLNDDETGRAMLSVLQSLWPVFASETSSADRECAVQFRQGFRQAISQLLSLKVGPTPFRNRRF